MIQPKPCPDCGRAPTISKSYAWHVSCGRCYDGAPDAGKRLHGYDLDSKDVAVEWWNLVVSDYIDDQAIDAELQAVEHDEYLRGREIDRRIDEARGK